MSQTNVAAVIVLSEAFSTISFACHITDSPFCLKDDDFTSEDLAKSLNADLSNCNERITSMKSSKSTREGSTKGENVETWLPVDSGSKLCESAARQSSDIISSCSLSGVGCKNSPDNFDVHLLASHVGQSEYDAGDNPN